MRLDAPPKRDSLLVAIQQLLEALQGDTQLFRDAGPRPSSDIDEHQNPKLHRIEVAPKTIHGQPPIPSLVYVFDEQRRSSKPSLLAASPSSRSGRARSRPVLTAAYRQPTIVQRWVDGREVTIGVLETASGSIPLAPMEVVDGTGRRQPSTDTTRRRH